MTEQPSLPIYSVSDLTGYLREYLEVNPLLQDIWVEGEASNSVISGAGHLYFTLKDKDTSIRCVSFRGQIARRALQRPENGAQVVVHGRVSLYPAQSSCQLYVDVIQPAGTGALHLRFEELRARLEREGLFEESRKRALPRFPERIGVVTSPTGAAWRDIISVLGRRYPLAEVVLAPAQVQGDGAVEAVCRSIEALNYAADIAVIILARGGGSLEDLWTFNEEAVARAIFRSRAPVVSGVGHETDTTIADMVADLRAATPTAAAELVSPNLADCQRVVRVSEEKVLALILRQMTSGREDVRTKLISLRRLSPGAKLQSSRREVAGAFKQLGVLLQNRLALAGQRVGTYGAKLDALNPLAVLGRGYSICWKQAGRTVVSSVAATSQGERLRVQVADGSFPVTVD